MFPVITSYLSRKDFDKYHIDSGINLTAFEDSNFDDLSRKALDKICEDGFNSVMINKIYLQDNLKSNIINETSSFDEKYLEDLCLYSYLNKNLRILINTKTGEPRTKINPLDIVLWKKNYSEIIIENSKIAEKYSIEKFEIVSELDSLLINNIKFFNDLALNARNFYNNKIGCSITFNNDEDLNKIDLLNDMNIDFIGIDFYVSMENDFKDTYFEHLYYLKKIIEHSKKDLIITEVGYRSVRNGNKKPMFNYKIDGVQDNLIQKKSYENFFNALLSKELNNKKIKGVYLWITDNNLYHQDILNTSLTGYSIFNKDAEDIVKKFNKDKLYYFYNKSK